MQRRSFIGGALAGLSITGAFAAPQKAKAGDIPTTTFGKAGVRVSVIAQGGARMDLHLRKMTSEEIADVRKRVVVGSGVYTGPGMEYWKKKA